MSTPQAPRRPNRSSRIRRWIIIVTLLCTIGAVLVANASLLGASDAQDAVQAEYEIAAATPVRLEVQEAASMPRVPHGAVTQVVDGKLTIFGGVDAWPSDSDFSNASFNGEWRQLRFGKEQTSLATRLMRTFRITHSQEVPSFAWETFAATNIPEADLNVAYSAATAHNGWLIVAGGITSKGVTAQVFALRLKGEADAEEVEAVLLPTLPRPTALAGAVVKDGVLYVAGGIRDLSDPQPLADVFSLEIKSLLSDDKEATQEETPEWKPQSLALKQPGDPGEPPNALQGGVIRPLLLLRKDDIANRDAIYILGGWTRDVASGQLVPSRGVWKYLDKPPQRAGWFAMAPAPEGTLLTRASVLGQSHILLFGDANRPPASGLGQALGREGAASTLLYHTFTNRWVDLGWEHEVINDATPVSIDPWLAILPASDATNPKLLVAVIRHSESLFHYLDWTMIAIYIIALLVIGGYFARKERNTEDYFLGGRKVPWWAAGLSIYATGISAISFMAIPAKTYATNWTYISQGILPVLATFIVAYLFVPLLRRLNITTVMEYQHKRFDASIRLLASALVVTGQVMGRMGVVLMLPSLALSAVTNLPLGVCVLIMGGLATAYTVAGGINAVIWTDVLQVVVVFGGAVLAFFIIAAGTEGGFGGMIDIGSTYGKFESFDFALDFTSATIWVFLLWGLSDLVGARMGQEYMQRAFSTEGVKSARRSLIVCAIVSIPGTLIFYSLGSALFGYYHTHPDELNPVLGTDATLPLFIAQKLPIGLAGLVIAGLFAAAMSTLDSGMNTVSTIIVTDWYGVFGKKADERTRLRAARIVTLAAGMLGTGMALYFGALNIRSLWDTFIEISALIGGGFGGVILLGLLTKRASAFGAWVGIVAGAATMWAIKFHTDTSVFIYGTLAMTVCIIVGYIASLIVPNRKPLDGLTIWTMKPAED